MFNKFSLQFSIFALLISLAGCASEDVNANLTRGIVPSEKKVVVVEFSDFNCPACRSAASLAHEVCADDRIYCEFRHFPLPIAGHETSRDAANAYECAAAQNFAREMENALFDNQGKFTPELLAELPTKYGFANAEKFDDANYRICFAEKKFDDLVSKDLKTAIDSGINATPTFVVNGKIIQANELKEEVAQALQNIE